MEITRPVVNLNEIQNKLLDIMCSNSGECITFGRYVDIITDFFENYDFKYLHLLTFQTPILSA
jgi:hypothetical protein